MAAEHTHVWKMEPLEVRVTTEGVIEIAQGYAHEEEVVIYFSPAQAEALVSWIQMAADEAVGGSES